MSTGGSPKAPPDSAQPTAADIMAELKRMSSRLDGMETELVQQQSRLSNITNTPWQQPMAFQPFQTPTGMGPPQAQVSFGAPPGMTQQQVPYGMGFGAVHPPPPTQAGLSTPGLLHRGEAIHAGGPYALTPPLAGSDAPGYHARATYGRPSMGISGFPLPEHVTPRAQRAEMPAPKDPFSNMRAIPNNSDPSMMEYKSQLFSIWRSHLVDIHPDWNGEKIDQEAKQKAAIDYLDFRKKRVDAAFMPASHSSDHDWRKKINWHMVKNITKLTPTNWAVWRSGIYSLLSTVPCALAMLEGIIHGPRYFTKHDLTSHPEYDEHLDRELGQVVASTVEDSVRGHIIKAQSEGEARGSIFYKELRHALQPAAGYAAMRLDKKIGKTRQGDTESIRDFGERLRTLFLEIQAAGEPIPEQKQLGNLLRGLRLRYATARDNIVARQALGTPLTFDTALTMLCDTEQAFAALDEPRRLPHFSRPSAQLAEDDENAVDEDSDVENEQALAARWNNQGRPYTGPPRPFNKACHCCKQVGHRAVDCKQTPTEAISSEKKAFVATAGGTEHSPCEHHRGCGNISSEPMTSVACGIPALGAFEAQVWEDQLSSLPAALNVVNDA